jgi:hypothetical protein
MATPEEQARFIRIAVELLQTQNPRAIVMLKDFLTCIPSPTSIRSILATAVAELIDISPTTLCWLLQHPEYLQPEVNVVKVVTQTLINRLIGLGFISGQDFDLSVDRTFEVSEAAKVALTNHSHFFGIQNPLPIIDALQKQ